MTEVFVEQPLAWPGSANKGEAIRINHPVRQVEWISREYYPFNLSENTKNSWLNGINDDLTVKNSALQPVHCIHWRVEIGAGYRSTERRPV